MKIAVTYENGTVFQHFGHTEQFRLYDVDNGTIVSSEVVGTNGSGHEALAVFLKDNDVDVLLCGGIGAGAKDALDAEGIAVCSGVTGGADEAVASYLRGELVSSGVNCDHHHEDGHSCHDHHHDGDDACGCGHHHEEEDACGCGHHHEEEDACGCGDSCGGGCGGCHGCGAPAIEGKNVGKTVRAHYKGTFNDGTQFDSSYDRGEPLEFVCGAGMMIRGFDEAVANMDVGQTVQIHLMPAEAYGETDPDAVFTVEIAKLRGSEELTVGQQVFLRDVYGRPFKATVAAKDETTITFDANHEMAGKELNFTIELVEIRE